MQLARLPFYVLWSTIAASIAASQYSECSIREVTGDLQVSVLL